MAEHGGKRVGAGRKAGARNKATAERQAAVEASGISPLDYLLQVMRDDKNEQGVRIEAAKAAAPYVHPKLQSVVLHGNNDDGSFTFNINLNGADARA